MSALNYVEYFSRQRHGFGVRSIFRDIIVRFEFNSLYLNRLRSFPLKTNLLDN